MNEYVMQSETMTHGNTLEVNMLFKILHGNPSSISLDITPFHEGWCYVTHDGYFYVDLNTGTEEIPNNQRLKLNANNA